jgi:hypothetical protein
MTDAGTERLQQFHRELERSGSDYLHVTAPQPGCAHIRFTGPFEGRTILWDATVMTLAHYRELAASSGTVTDLRQFIEVGPQRDQLRRLVIGLNVARIDTPVLLKTIIMVRKYKRLQRGRHEYGAACCTPAGQPHGA